MQINKHTIAELDPDKMSDQITTGKATVTIDTIETGMMLLTKLIQALQGRKQLRRRVDVLENIVANQQKVLELIMDR